MGVWWAPPRRSALEYGRIITNMITSQTQFEAPANIKTKVSTRITQHSILLIIDKMVGQMVEVSPTISLPGRLVVGLYHLLTTMNLWFVTGHIAQAKQQNYKWAWPTESTLQK